MDCKNRIIKLRESTGLNRKDFCKLVNIPYRTMTEWELDNRHAPEDVYKRQGNSCRTFLQSPLRYGLLRCHLIFPQNQALRFGIPQGLSLIHIFCPFSFESVLSLIPSAETIPLNIGMDTTPVSYTHLDVYKRQYQNRSVLC